MPATPTPSGTPAMDRCISGFRRYVGRYAVELLLIALVVYICVSRGVALRVDVHDPAPPPAAITPELVSQEAGVEGWFTTLGRRLLASVFDTHETQIIAPLAGLSAVDEADHFGSVARTNDPAPHISNLTLVLSPDYGERNHLPAHIVAAKKQRVQNYLTRYAPAAREEMRKHGIPASITLAQALLESNAGDSKLAVNSNNHFGIKCRSKCLGCTCRNYGDDTRYDMFRVFGSVAESFAEHSTLLNTPRYAKLKRHGKDYRQWAHGLRACGYATDKRYGHKLITIIENLKLDRYDA